MGEAKTIPDDIRGTFKESNKKYGVDGVDYV